MTLQNAIALIQHPGIGETASAQWADLGCGSGLFTFALASQLQPGSHIYAADKSAGVLEKHANPHKIGIEFIQLDFVQASLPFKELDGILMANALHFVAEKTAFIKKLTGHLKKTGRFLLVEYDTDKPNRWVPYPTSIQTLQLLFAAAGYGSFELLGQLPSVYNTARLFGALIKK